MGFDSLSSCIGLKCIFYLMSSRPSLVLRKPSLFGISNELLAYQLPAFEKKEQGPEVRLKRRVKV